MYNELKDKIVLVTGGTRGIGFSTAKLFLQCGAKVAIIGRTEETLNKAKEKLSNFATNLYGVYGDLANELYSCFYDIEDNLGNIQILVNCAGIALPSDFEKISLSDWNYVLAVNLTAPFLLSQLVSPNMKSKKYGKIINISSIAGRNYSRLCGLHYSCSKAALITMTKQLAAELGPYNINVNCICPGQTYTDMLEPFLENDGEEKIIGRIPLGYIAQPEQQAKIILFLASDASNYLNGTIIDSTGGQL